MSEARNRKAWGLVGRQHGMVARRQLLALGFSAAAISHRVASGRLHPVARGIYAVGWPYLDQRRRWAAAVLAAASGDRVARFPTQPYLGNGAALSHRSAAALWGIAVELPRRIDLTVRRRAELQRPGLRIRGRPSLAERAVNDADKRDLIDPESLRGALDDHRGEPGVRPLRQVLDRLTFLLSDSNLEIYFRPIAASAGLPAPLSKHRINGFEVDFFWPQLGLVVETDGLRYHRTPSAQKRDALRDRTHVIAGMTPLRFTHYEIRYEPNRVRSDLASAASMLQKRFRH